MKHSKYILIIFMVAFFYGDTLWGAPTQSQINAIYTSVSGGRPFSVDGTTATFSDGTNNWTIFGAVQEKGDLYTRPSVWSVTGDYEIKIVDQVISDTMILPFSDPVPNISSNSSISIQAYRGEYEPASFVLRSGNAELSDVKVSISDLILQGANSKIYSTNVDIRAVKCWFQAGMSIDRRQDNKKRLVSELLLLDSDLVKVDYEHQVNLVRNYSQLSDATQLLPFSVIPRSNQQVWITVQVPDSCLPGVYQAQLNVEFKAGENDIEKKISFELNVKSERLPSTPNNFALFYLGLYRQGYTGFDGFKKGSTSQLLAEFKDIHEHGLTNLAFMHTYFPPIDGQPDLSDLETILSVFREAGFLADELLYVDWKLQQWDDLTAYQFKLESIFNVAKKYGFRGMYIYGKDESTYDELVTYKRNFEITHDVGAKNFVSCERNVAVKMDGLLDVAIIPRATSLIDFDVVGGELFVNGDMSIELNEYGVGWKSSNDEYMTINNGVCKKKLGEYTSFSQQVALQEGKNYIFSYEVKKAKNAEPYLATGGGSCFDENILLEISVGTHKKQFRANGNSSFRLALNLDDEFEFDNASLVAEGVSQSKRSVVPWAYNDPQLGQETPATYKSQYGSGLLDDGFKGICCYAYQHGDCWDDWSDPVWRPHVMSYPTAGAPIPTLQWEGFREGMDDLRKSVLVMRLQPPKNLNLK